MLTWAAATVKPDPMTAVVRIETHKDDPEGRKPPRGAVQRSADPSQRYDPRGSCGEDGCPREEHPPYDLVD